MSSLPAGSGLLWDHLFQSIPHCSSHSVRTPCPWARILVGGKENGCTEAALQREEGDARGEQGA